MHFSGIAVAAAVFAVLAALALCFVFPFALAALFAWGVVRIAGLVFGRGARKADGVSDGDVARDLGLAVGLLVVGVLWCVSRHHFAAILLGVGAAALTRGLLGLRRADAVRA